MAQPKGGGGADNNMEMWVFLIIVIFILIFWAFSELFWVYATAWKWIRVAEVGLASFIVPDFIQKFTGWDFNGAVSFLLGSDPRDLTAEIIGAFDNMYLKFFNWLPGLLIALAGAKIFLGADNVSNKYTMETLLIKMSHAFPNNKMFMNVHPELTPLDFYPEDPSSYDYSMVMTERQFAQVVPPLGLLKYAEKDKSVNRPIWDGAKGFDDELCRRSFEAQMGPLYQGFNMLGEDEKKLFTLFRDKILVKGKEASPLVKYYMEQIIAHRVKNNLIPQEEAARKKLDVKSLAKPELKYLEDFASHKAIVQKLTSIVDGLLVANGPRYKLKDIDVRKSATSKEMKPVLQAAFADARMSKHAYVYTGLMTLLEAAREGSTLPPSSFRWLKPRNRTLWYALNCVGKKVSFTESGGTFAHWLLEKETKMAVPHPEVTEAVEALRIALDLPSRFASKEAIDQWG